MNTVSIVIVNYKQPQLAYNCIKSIYDFTTSLSFEIILVNNDIDNSCEQILAHYPNTVYLHTKENIGFGRANNIGISHTKYNNVLLLNSDCVLTPNCLTNLIPIFELSSFMACGIQLLNSDDSFQHGGWHFSSKNLGVFLKWPYLQQLHTFISGKRTHKASNTNEPVIVDWINGAFLLFKKDLVEPIKYFDEEFFLYSEETEWCYRMGAAGGTLAVYPNLTAYHLQGATTKQAFSTANNSVNNVFDKLGLQMLVSEFLRTKKQFGKQWVCIHYIASLLYFIPCIFIWLIDSLFNKSKAQYTFQQIRQYATILLQLGSWVKIMLTTDKYFYRVL